MMQECKPSTRCSIKDKTVSKPQHTRRSGSDPSVRYWIRDAGYGNRPQQDSLGRAERIAKFCLGWIFLIVTVGTNGCDKNFHKSTNQLQQELLQQGATIRCDASGNVQEVHLTASSIVDGFALLAREAPSIRVVAVSNAHLTTSMIQRLSNLDGLEILDLRNVHLDAPSLASLKSLRVPRLTLRGETVDDATIKSFNVENLQSLHISSARITDDAFDSISHAQNIRNLSIFKCEDIHGAGLQKLEGLNLESLNLFGTEVQAKHLASIAAIKNLRTLHLYGKQIDDDNIDFLLQCRKIEILSFFDTSIQCIAGHLIQELPLRKLTLSGSPFSDVGVTQLTACKQLEELSLDRTKVTNNGLLDLKGVQNLRRLVLGANSPAEAEHLRGLESEFANCELLIIENW